MWPSGLARWLVDFVLASSVQIPATAKIMIVISCAPLERVLKSRQPQSVPTMLTSLWWNHLSDHPLVQWGITRGVSQETSLPRKGLLKKINTNNYKHAKMCNKFQNHALVQKYQLAPESQWHNIPIDNGLLPYNPICVSTLFRAISWQFLIPHGTSTT